MCANIPLSYIFDMYKLYTNLEITEIILETLYEKVNFKQQTMECFFLQDDINITLKLPELYDPELWLYKPFQNIVAYNLKNECPDASLELYICFINKTMKYYAIGKNSIVLISKANENDTILIHTSTIDMLLKKSIYCNRPFIWEIDFKI